MSLNYVTLTLDVLDGEGNYPSSGSAAFTPSAVLTGPGIAVIGQIPVTATFRSVAPSVRLLATDNAGFTPSPWTWGVTFAGVAGAPAPFSFALPFSNGASQLLSSVH